MTKYYAVVNNEGEITSGYLGPKNPTSQVTSAPLNIFHTRKAANDIIPIGDEEWFKVKVVEI